MVLSFDELGIDTTFFNGMRYGVAKALILNRACDYVMQHFFGERDEHEVILDIMNDEVNFIMRTVSITTADVTLH